MTLDEAGIGMSPADMEQFLMVQDGGKTGFASCWLKFRELAALLNITAASPTVHSVVSSLTVSVKANGSRAWTQILLKKGSSGAHSTGVLRKLVLNVQVRNVSRARFTCIKKLGFEIERLPSKGLIQLKEERYSWNVYGGN